MTPGKASGGLAQAQASPARPVLLDSLALEELSRLLKKKDHHEVIEWLARYSFLGVVEEKILTLRTRKLAAGRQSLERLACTFEDETLFSVFLARQFAISPTSFTPGGSPGQAAPASLEGYLAEEVHAVLAADFYLPRGVNFFKTCGSPLEESYAARTQEARLHYASFLRKILLPLEECKRQVLFLELLEVKAVNPTREEIGALEQLLASQTGVLPYLSECFYRCVASYGAVRREAEASGRSSGLSLYLRARLRPFKLPQEAQAFLPPATKPEKV